MDDATNIVSSGRDRTATAGWRAAWSVSPSLPVSKGHTLHAYPNACPESPDGRRVLFFASPTPEGHEGELAVYDRRTGETRVLSRVASAEDAHRGPCQQWLDSGRQAVFHDWRDGVWSVFSIDIASGRERALAADRQLGFGAVSGRFAPLCGPHWDAAAFRDLELVDVGTGERRLVLRAGDVVDAFRDRVEALLGTTAVSIFFPCLSPDGRRVLFKLATPGDGEVRSPRASRREGRIVFDLERREFLRFDETWGHPAWFGDSRRVLATPNRVLDIEDDRDLTIPNLPRFPGSHPCPSSDGRTFVSDVDLERFDDSRGEWGIVVADVAGAGWRLIHRMDAGGGARSWRPAHPHPVFSADGRRVYFNANDAEWTRLLVAELCEGARAS